MRFQEAVAAHWQDAAAPPPLDVASLRANGFHTSGVRVPMVLCILSGASREWSCLPSGGLRYRLVALPPAQRDAVWAECPGLLAAAWVLVAEATAPWRPEEATALLAAALALPEDESCGLPHPRRTVRNSGGKCWWCLS